MMPVAFIVPVAAAAALAVTVLFRPDRPDPGDMVDIPGGPAVLGGQNIHSMPGPRPYLVAPFRIDRYEVTNAQFRAFVADTGAPPPAFAHEAEFGADDQPVTGVTWDQAQAYCRWVGKRLPSETEWEKAARGPDGRLYPWGNGYEGSEAAVGGDLPVPVTAYPRDVSLYGVRGMGGNVSEWVADTRLAQGGVCGARQGPESDPALAYLAEIYGEENLNICSIPDISPELAPVEKCAFIKGNSWSGRPHMTVASNRMWDYADAYAEFVGFRCAVSAGDSL